MNAKQIFLSVIIAGAAVYFAIKYMPDLERLAGDGGGLLVVLLLGSILVYMGYRVLTD